MSALEQMKDLLGKSVRVVLLDGRIIEGNLLCMDKDMSFVIGEANEFHGVENPAEFDVYDTVVRNIGSATISGIHIKQVFALC